MIKAKFISDLKFVFAGYDFEYRQDFSDECALVFTIQQGIFENAVIVIVDECKYNKSLGTELASCGFSVKEYNFTSVVSVEDELFNGFFAKKRTQQNFLRDYDFHIDKIRASFPDREFEYQYISAPYVKNSSDEQLGGNIISEIISEIEQDGPKLILLEAAAGFGKTCTAFEIGKEISKSNTGKIVLLAELSRDRQAKVFNHVFYKELARSFPAVTPDLALREIKKGKIVVILDGFDELLKDKNDDGTGFEKTQAMLETIGEILDKNAKVILTTRKTAILQGDDFEDWISTHENDFDFVRYSLREPEINNWLDYDRLERLKESRIDVKNISNPVLLTFLKFTDIESFNVAIRDPDSIVDQYFSSMCMREMKRQNLKLNVDEQSLILTGLAVDMMLFDYTRDSKDNMLKYFSENEYDLIEESRTRYSIDEMPTFEALVDSFSNHALLDRSKSDDKIGFINDFVLGHFVALNLKDAKDREWVAESIFIEAAINSYSSRSLASREAIWNDLAYALDFLSKEQKINLELRLLDRASGHLSEVQFNGTNFETSCFFTDGSVTDCYFHECMFKGCELDFEKVKNCVFISCLFYECTSIGDAGSNNFISCKEDGGSVLSSSMKEDLIPEIDNASREVKVFILEKFWPIGKDAISFAHRPLPLFYRGGHFSPGLVSLTIESLKRDGVLIAANRKNWIGLDSSAHYGLIKELLGR